MKYKIINSQLKFDDSNFKQDDYWIKSKEPDADAVPADAGDATSKKQDDTSCCPLLLSYNDAPSYLKFNPYIRTGYRGFLTSKMCVESIFWWTNETVNIWSHMCGFVLFLGLTLYDFTVLKVEATWSDMFIAGFLLTCFQACMVLSSLYHTFSCRSEEIFASFLTWDLFGIALSLLAIYISGIYYAFWCYKGWCQFYMVTIVLIFALAMIMQLPSLDVDSHVKMLVFIGWAVYGVLPTMHWAIIMGGWQNQLVQLLLPRVMGMYGITGLAFLIYITKFPERFFTGKVDYIGSSHQWWHIIIVGALYYWHNTGILYIRYRLNHTCNNDMSL